MIDKELIDKIKHVQLWARSLANNSLTGEYSSVFKGIGMEFDEFRKYVPRDEIKHIDWKVTARTQETHVKVFKEERDLTILLVVDVSSSQSFGLKKTREKVNAAAELAALVAILATKHKDKVGLIVFTDDIEHYIPPGRGGHTSSNSLDVLMHKQLSKGTNISKAALYAGKVMRKRGLMVFISDFQDDDYISDLSVLAKKHDLVCANTFDQAEMNPPSSSLSGFIDPETGQYLDINYSLGTDAGMRGMDDWAKSISQLGGDPFFVRSDESAVKPLIKFLRQREARKRR